jgi:alpha-tubulin suppressor-like RCC1 family protein
MDYSQETGLNMLAKNIISASGISGGPPPPGDSYLFSWGRNTIGTIGNNTSYVVMSPVLIGTNEWLDAAIASNTIAAIKTDGTLWTWGDNVQNRLGISDTSIVRSSPVQLGTASNYVQVEAGDSANFIALRSDGTVWGWGANPEGALLAAPTTQSRQLAQLTGYSDVVQVAAGGVTVRVLRSDGTIWSWGSNTLGGSLGNNSIISRSSPVQTGTDSDWAQIGVAGYSGSAFKTDGTLWVWGYNNVGQLGLGNVVSRSSPVQLGVAYEYIQNGDTGTFRKSDGTVWRTGSNPLIDFSITARSSPVQLGTSAWDDAVGGGRPLVLSRAGKTQLFGLTNSAPTLALDDFTQRLVTTPTLIGTYLDEIRKVQAQSSGGAAVLVTETNLLYYWGVSALSGVQTPINMTPLTYSSPVQIGNAQWSQVYAGGVGVCYGIKTDGTLWTWGSNQHYTSAGEKASLSPVQLGSASDWTQISALSRNAVALKANGTLWSWGTGTIGLGVSNDLRSSPVQVGTVSNWTQITTTAASFAGVRADGTLWTWGNSALVGQGNAFVPRSAPSQVGTLSNWAQVSGGIATIYAIKTDGTLWAWGQAPRGDGFSTGVRSSPVQIGTDSNWAQVTCTGGTNTGFNNAGLGVKTDGTLWAWGINIFGNLGLGDTSYRSTPVQVGNLSDWVQVSTGWFPESVSGFTSPTFCTAAVKADGSLWMWGANFGGTLIDGTTINRSSPVQVAAGTYWKAVSVGTVDPNTSLNPASSAPPSLPVLAIGG